ASLELYITSNDRLVLNGNWMLLLLCLHVVKMVKNEEIWSSTISDASWCSAKKPTQ
ncbi:hypothetical protein PanWU01x14_135990, partial [Parasponia andersonii]